MDKQEHSMVKIQFKATETLFPDPRMVSFGVKNNSYARSLFTGIVTPIFQLPALLWNCVFKHVLFGLGAIITFIGGCFWYGVTGRVIGLKPADGGDLFESDNEG